MLRGIKDALANLRPHEVRETAQRRLEIGLIATTAAGYTAMEKFLAPPSEISRERRLTLCMSLHNVDLAREFFPRLIGIRAGRIVFDRSSALHDREVDDLYDLCVKERVS